MTIEWNAPASVAASKRFEVTLGNRPKGAYDDIQIWNPRTEKVVSDERIRGRETLKLKAPAEPGTYQLHYWMGTNSRVKTTRELKVQ